MTSTTCVGRAREGVALDLGALDLNALRALRALLEEGNLTYAGAKIGMAQPGMSSLLGRFRRHFSDELLVRVGRDHELTPLARQLLPAVQEALRRVEEVLRVSDKFDPSTSTRLFTIAASDYALTVFLEPLIRRIGGCAPDVQLSLVDLPDDLVDSPRALLRFDCIVGPLGFGLSGGHSILFRDRLVCVTAKDNPHLVDGVLGMDALRVMPHAVAGFGGANLTPVDRVLGQRGVVRRTALRALGYLPLPFTVEGTDIVAVMPERLARRFSSDGSVVVVDPPFGLVELVEAAWWHPSRDADPAHQWLRSQLTQISDELTDSPRRGGADSPSATGTQEAT